MTDFQWEQLKRLAQACARDQLLWASGYLAGLAASPTAGGMEMTASPAPSAITVLYGSQTGNAEKLARLLHARLQEQGVDARLECMDSYKPAQLKRDRFLLAIVSTHGEGDPPDNARPFYEFLSGKHAPRLAELKYSVLALGDASYEHFCKIGRDLDARLETLGAVRLHECVECDVDYEEAAEGWMQAVAAVLPVVGGGQVEAPASMAVAQAPAYDRKNPFLAPLIENLCLNGRGSSKEVRHIELSLEGSGLSYQPGDSLAVIPGNWPQRVHELIAALGMAADAPVEATSGQQTTLEDALLRHYEITTLTRPFLEQYARLSESSELKALLRDRSQLKTYLWGREIIDVVRTWPVPGLAAVQFLGLLRKLPPRLYSIASSYNANPDEVHLTVAVVRYESHGMQRHGVASTFLADRVGEDGQVPVYVESNPNFRLPENPEAAIIMVGPGTGVAPFRSFLAEREFTGASGRNWLFFGDRNFHTDFLYQREWLEHRRKGLLQRIDVAFSRDQEEKVYVQQRMRENGRELYAWLEEGAYFYVCGDGQRMANDMHEALITVVSHESGRSREAAEEYVNALQANRRYQRDVY